MHRIVVYISGHGYGHAAQTLPVLDELWNRIGPFDVLFRSSLPDAFFQSRYRHPYSIHPAEFDFGMAMTSAIDVDAMASARRYRALHANWDALVEQEGDWLRASGAHLVLSNVGYVGLAAAGLARIPSVAMSSLNWHDIYANYCGNMAGAEAILTQMQQAYQRAECFIQMTPAMPMTWLPRRHVVGPVTRIGVSQRAALQGLLKARSHARLILVSLGGIQSDFSLERWPSYDNTYWLVPQEWHVEREDIIPFPRLGLSFNALLCSVDALVTKPGYGSFVEAACNGVPLLYLPRGDWPEEPYLTSWAHQHTRAVEITREAFTSGNLEQALRQAATMPLPPRPVAAGNVETALLIAEIVAKRCD